MTLIACRLLGELAVVFADATLDTSFTTFSPVGSGNVPTTRRTSCQDTAYAMVLQPDRKIVLGGNVRPGLRRL